MAEFSISKVSTNDVSSIEKQINFKKGKNIKDAYQAMSDYTVMFFENAVWKSLEDGKIGGLSKKEFDQLYSFASGLSSNNVSQIKIFGNREKSLLNNLKKFSKNAEYLKSELQTAKDKYNALLNKEGVSKSQIEDAKKELNLIQENIISSRTIEENRSNYY